MGDDGLLVRLLPQAEPRDLVRVDLEVLVHVVLPPGELDGDEAIVLAVGPLLPRLLLGLAVRRLLLGLLRAVLAAVGNISVKIFCDLHY